MENAAQPQKQGGGGMLGRLIFLVFLAVILGGFWYFTKIDNANVSENEKNGGIGAEVVHVEGAVEYKTANGEWKRVERGTSLKEGDSVEIVGAGRAIVSLDDGSAIRLNDGSSITLTLLSPDQYIITNEKGEVYARVAKMDRVFEVKAGDIVYQSVGTAYKTINKDEKQGVEVYENKVKIKGISEEEILVEEGNKYFVVNSEDKTIEKTFVKITEKDVVEDEFVKWNQEEDEKMEADGSENKEEVVEETEKVEEAKEEETVPEPNTATIQASGISLSVKSVDTGVKLSWSISGITAPNGFKLVKSTSINPVYPGSSYIYLSDPSVRSYTWSLKDGQTYYFRVCRYIDGKCTLYSNNAKATAPLVVKEQTVSEKETETSSVTSIVLSYAGENSVTWKTTGYSASGFKIVWSKNANPTYPTRDGDQYIYLSAPSAAATTLKAFSGEGLYYVRVCEYLGGKCGLYSNQIEVNL